MKTKRANRLLALLLSLVMVVGLLPMSVLAAGETKTVTVAKAELGTSAAFGGDQVDLSNALYTFVGSGTTGYTISATVPGTETTVYLNIGGGGTAQLPNMTSANATRVALTNVTVDGVVWFRLKDGSALYFYNNNTAKLHFDRTGDFVTDANAVCHNFALFRAADEGENSSVEIPGYVRLTALDEVDTEGKYLIAAKASNNWYVLYPTTSNDKYAHVAKVVLVEEEVQVTEPEEPEVPEIPDEPEPQEKPRHYFESVDMEGGAWKISDGSVPNPNTMETQNGSNWISATEIVGGANYRLWAPGPGYLNFDKVGDVLLANKLRGGQNAASIQFEKQNSNVYLISYVKDGWPYYLTAENQEYNGQDRAVFSRNKADAVPYFVELTEGTNIYRIYCEGPYTVNFDGEGAEDIASLEGVYYGTTLPTPADREGYTFLGWFDGETKYTEATADVTLTAKWKMDAGYTPEDAVAEGKTVTYLAFTGGTSSSRWWDAANEAGATTHIQLYNAAGTTATSATTLDTDGITAGNYVINFDTGSSSRQAVMHYSSSVINDETIGVTNQCSSVSVTCGTNGPLHLFVFEKAEGNTAINAFTIKAYNTTKYLSLEASGNNRLFKDDKTTFYITPVNEPNDGNYYIWTAVDPEPDPGDDDTQTCANPAEAVAEGKTVTYLAFTGGTSSNRWWDAASTAGNTTKIQLYNAAGTTADSATTLDTDGITAGNYVINFDTGNSGKQAVMHYSNGVTNQCSAVSVTCGTNGPLHLFVFEKAEDNTAINAFTIKAYNTTKYLSLEASGSQRAFKDDKTTFYITPVNDPNDGTYYIWTATEPQVDVITPPVEPEGDVTMAQTKFSGISDKPMDRRYILNQDDDVDTEYRIPALTTLDNGWIVAACDIRWSSTQDSPNNLDTIVSISKDGGESWEWEVVNYFSDFAPINDNSQRENSASFIDPALLVSNDGTLWMAVDLQPAHVNLRQNAQKTGSGFDEDGLLMVGPISEAEWATKVDTSLGRTEATRLEYQAQYKYRVDINGVNSDSVTATATKDGEEVKVYAIFHKDTEETTGYYVDAFCDLYYDYGEGGIKPVIVAQKESTDYTQANLFYIQSPWKAYSTTYLMIRKATVKGEGLAWGDPQLISGVKNFDGEAFLVFCPGRGTSIQVAGENGKTVERIIFPVYDNVSSERASSVYTDDGGETWHRGARVGNGETTSNSESQIVELHDVEGGRFLRMFSRNPDSGQYVSYADSFDNGLTWTTTKFDRNMPNGYGTMMSFIGLEGVLVSPEGDVYEDLVLASYPRGTGSGRRSNGIVRIGYYDAENAVMVWLNGEDAIRYPYEFTYSCLTQLRDGDGFTDRFALLYEDERNWHANYGMEMGFDTFTSADLLGEGWSLVQKAVEDKILVAPIAEQLYTGEPIEPAVTVKKNGVVMTEGYTVEYGNNTEVGEATVTVTVGEIVVEATFQIAEYAIGGIAEEPYDYTGSAIRPAVTLTRNGESVDPAEYAVSYRDNTEAGTATVIVRVEGNIVARATFQIVKPDDEYTIGDIADRVYTGEAIEPYVTVRKNGAVVTTGFEVEYKNNENIGTATVTVLVDGVAVAEATFKITPAPVDGNTTGGAANPPVVVVPEDPTEELEDPTEELEDPDVPLTDLPMLFEDVTEDDWFYEAVKYSFDQGMMDGIEETEFAPNANTNRGMIVTILYRLEQEPETDLASFTDVAAGQWYAAGVAWGQDSGVIEGMDDGTFCPTQDVTREQLAAFLFRYAKYKSYDVSARGELTVFRDGESTSAWATDFVCWAVGNELIQGKENDILDPKGTATRAEVATILMRFCEKFMK